MAKQFQYSKICNICGNLYTSPHSTTKYCSERCSNRANKIKAREKLLQTDSHEIKERQRKKLLDQEFLSISETANLLGISRPTLYKMIANGIVKAKRFSEKIVRIKRSDLEQIQPSNIAPINTPIAEIHKVKQEHITVAEALKKFEISLTWFYKKIRPTEIKPTIINGKPLYPLQPLTKLFAQKQYANIAEWYTVADIVEKFGVSRAYVYEYIYNHKIPKKKQGKEVLISKYHWELSKGLDPTENENYYTVHQVTEKFNIGRSYLYDLIRHHKIPKIKRGNGILIHRQTLDNLMNNRKK
jgi:excisionase family DNA binding protein